MKKIILLLSIGVIIFFPGCGQSTCIGLKGENSNFSGSVRYCWDKEHSFLSGGFAVKDDKGEILYGLKAQELNDLSDILEGASANDVHFQSDPLKRLKNLLEIHKQIVKEQKELKEHPTTTHMMLEALEAKNKRDEKLERQKSQIKPEE